MRECPLPLWSSELVRALGNPATVHTVVSCGYTHSVFAPVRQYVGNPRQEDTGLIDTYSSTINKNTGWHKTDLQ
jgi:hypothetical protein